MKKTNNNEVISKVKETLTKAKVAMTEKEIQEIIPEVNRTILRQMVRKNILKESYHYLHNSAKTFIHKKTKKQETIKGTRAIKYSLN